MKAGWRRFRWSWRCRWRCSGRLITLTALGVDNNLYTQIGLMLLIALGAKNAILIVEVAREQRVLHGVPILEAAVAAAKARLRPILMTSFAFILGVVPLVLATGAGANARRIDRDFGRRPGCWHRPASRWCSCRASSSSCSGFEEWLARGKTSAARETV